MLETTTNGGRSWTEHHSIPPSMDGGIGSATCDQEACLITAYNLATTTGAISATTDGGYTWTAVLAPAWWAGNSITAELVACSAARCLAYGTNALTMQAPFRFGVAETSDGGRTWTDAAISGSLQVDQITCVWSGQCWALYDTGTDEYEHVATSTGAHSAWTDLGGITPSEVGGNTFVLDPDHQVGFACRDARTCFILDNSNDLLRSDDGGRHWYRSAPPRRADGSTDQETDAITCTRASTCWIIGGNSAWTGPSQ